MVGCAPTVLDGLRLPLAAPATGGALARFGGAGGVVLTGLDPVVGILCRFQPTGTADTTGALGATLGLEVGFLVGAGAVDEGFRAAGVAVGELGTLGDGALSSLGLRTVCFLIGAGEVLFCRCGGELLVDSSDAFLGDLVDRGLSAEVGGRLDGGLCGGALVVALLLLLAVAVDLAALAIRFSSANFQS